MKNKLAKITTTAMLVLTTNSLPSYALNEYSIAGLPKESETQINQVTDDNREPLIDKKTSPKPQLRTTTKPQGIRVPPTVPDDDQKIYCRQRFWHLILKKWVYGWVVCGITD